MKLGKTHCICSKDRFRSLLSHPSAVPLTSPSCPPHIARKMIICFVWEGKIVQDKGKVWSLVGEGWDGTESALASGLCWQELVAQVILNPEFPRNSSATLLFVPQLISISGSQGWILEMGNKENSSIYWMFGNGKKRKHTKSPYHLESWKAITGGVFVSQIWC